VKAILKDGTVTLVQVDTDGYHNTVVLSEEDAVDMGHWIFTYTSPVVPFDKSTETTFEVADEWGEMEVVTFDDIDPVDYKQAVPESGDELDLMQGICRAFGSLGDRQRNRLMSYLSDRYGQRE